MAQGFQTFQMGQGDQKFGTSKNRRWKGEAGQMYRFSLIWFDGIEEGAPDFGTPEAPKAPNFIGAPISYIPGVGYVVNNSPEITKLAGGDAPRTRIATVIAVWPLKRDGSPDGNRIQAGDASVQTFIMSGDRYEALTQINREFPFAQHDLPVKCEDTQYQKLTFSPCKENLWRRFIDGGDKAKPVVDPIMNEAAQLVANIQAELGRVMTPEQIKAKLGGGDSPTGPVSTPVTEDIDRLVDDLLG